MSQEASTPSKTPLKLTVGKIIMTLPTKELLSEVLGCFEIENIKQIDSTINYMEAIFEPSGQYDRLWFDKSINIHELAHKCKEWAWEEGFIIEVFPFGYTVYGKYEDISQRYALTNEEKEDKKPYKPEITFKACEWIRKQS